MLTGRRRARGADGFTLIELIITVAIVGIVVVAFSGILVQYFKTSKNTAARLNESTDQQMVSAYWQQDVASIGVRGYVPNAANQDDQFPYSRSTWSGAAPAGIPSGCTGLSGVVIGFAWNEYPVNADPVATWTNPTVNAVVYTSSQSGVQWILQRTRCSGGTSTTITVAHRLTQAPTVSCFDASRAPVSCGASTPPIIVSMQMVVSDQSAATATGYTTTVTGQRRQG